MADKMESDRKVYYRTAEDVVRVHPTLAYYKYHEEVDAWMENNSLFDDNRNRGVLSD